MNKKPVDIESLEKDLESLQNELAFWESYQPVNNMGKWSTSVKIERLQESIKKVENKIKKHKK